MEGRWLKKRRAEKETLGLKRLAGLSSPHCPVSMSSLMPNDRLDVKRDAVPRERRRDGGTLAEETLGG